MRIAVFGNYGVKNIGDDLILMGLMEKFKNDELMIYSGNPDQVDRQFNLTAHPFFPAGLRSFLKYLFSANYRRQLQRAYQDLCQADKIIIGGGGILVDKHFKAVLLWWRQLKVIARTEKAYQFLANSFELNHWWSRRLFKKYLGGAENITVRDSKSLQFIHSLGHEAELTDDLAWNLDLSFLSRGAASYRGTGLREGIKEENNKKICLALCKWGLEKSQKTTLQKFISDRISEGYQIVPLAFQSLGDDDRKVFSEIAPTLEVKTSLKDILQELSTSSLLVGMRFHALLLARRLNIPVIALAYQEKVSNFMKDQNREDQCIPVQKLDEQKLQELFQKVIVNGK